MPLTPPLPATNVGVTAVPAHTGPTGLAVTVPDTGCAFTVTLAVPGVPLLLLHPLVVDVR